MVAEVHNLQIGNQSAIADKITFMINLNHNYIGIVNGDLVSLWKRGSDKMEFSTYQNRKPLNEQLPLAAPLSIHVCPSTFCNFKCKYCVHSLGTPTSLPNGIKKGFMEYDTFTKLVEQLKEFPSKIKLLNFAYLGEPLLNEKIPDMVKLAKVSNVSDRVEIVSNGSMLTHALSDKLVDAGLDRLRISIQGLDSKEYYYMSKFRIDYSRFLEELRYLYKRSRNSSTKIYIKTVDAVVKTEERKKKFFDDFSECCDNLNIENLIPISNECDISGLKKEFNDGFFGNKVRNTKICSEVFYTIVITPEGDVYPCCTMGRPPIICGNILKEDIVQIWNGEKLRNLRIKMLHEGYHSFSTCKECGVPLYQTSSEDYLDDYIESLLKKY